MPLAIECLAYWSVDMDNACCTEIPGNSRMLNGNTHVYYTSGSEQHEVLLSVSI